MYIKRHMEKVVSQRAKTNQTVLLTGARQVGKSTMLESSAAERIPQFSLDDITLLASVERDAVGFLKANPPPIFIDEIQYAPDLFRGIKNIIDKRKNEDGLYFLTGSQKYELMQGVSETLSGRIAILNLLGLSSREIDGDEFNLPFIPTQEFLDARKNNAASLPLNEAENGISDTHKNKAAALPSNEAENGISDTHKNKAAVLPPNEAGSGVSDTRKDKAAGLPSNEAETERKFPDMRKNKAASSPPNEAETERNFSDMRKDKAASQIGRRGISAPPTPDIQALWKRIHRGFLPRLTARPDLDWAGYYSDYLKTYIERDVRKLSQVGDAVAFVNFMTAAAARTGQLLNIASVARDVGVSEPTVKKWLSILDASNIIYLLQPFSLNLTKRVVKAPKLYFLDTGLACYLCKWLTPETLQNGAMSGQIFETYVVGEILKSYYNAGKEPPIYFFRNDKAEEVDLLFYQNGALIPAEIKKTASPTANDVATFKLLSAAFSSVKIEGGALSCTYDKVLPLTDKATIIPITWL